MKLMKLMCVDPVRNCGIIEPFKNGVVNVNINFPTITLFEMSGINL